MTCRDRESLAWSLEYAARRLAGAFDLAAPTGVLGSHLLRGVWRAACRELHYLELMVRRLIVAMAGQVRLEVPRPGGARFANGFAPESKQKPAKAPVFPVFDRKPGLAALQRRLGAVAVWDGAHGDGDVPAPAACDGTFPRPEPARVVEAARLAARFAALFDVLEDPDRHARRLARWRARRQASPLRLGAVPALARGGTLDLCHSAFFEAERLALTVLNHGWPPPGTADPPGAPALAGQGSHRADLP